MTIAERMASAAARWDRAMTTVRRIRRERSRWLVTSSRPPDEATVRQRVRALIDGGLLPLFRSGRLWTGPCSMRRGCTICGTEIKSGEQEVEIASSAVVIFLHLRCFDIWTQMDGDGDQGPPRST